MPRKSKEMLPHEKLKKYIDDNGIQKKWFAEKIGVKPQYLYLILEGQRPIPKKCWLKIIELTHKNFKLEEFLQDVE